MMKSIRAAAMPVFLTFAAIATPACLPAAYAQDATAAQLAGSWDGGARGVWTFDADGKGRLVRNSMNGIPGKYTISLEWRVEPGNILVYKPVRNTLEGSDGYDKDEAIASPKENKAPFQIADGALVLGGQSYQRK
jgi:hypothetical protein